MKNKIPLSEAEKKLHEKIELIKNKIDGLQLEVKSAEENIKELQSFCNHSNYYHHHRQIAEESSYNECNICGAIF